MDEEPTLDDVKEMDRLIVQAMKENIPVYGTQATQESYLRQGFEALRNQGELAGAGADIAVIGHVGYQSNEERFELQVARGRQGALENVLLRYCISSPTVRHILDKKRQILADTKAERKALNKLVSKPNAVDQKAKALKNAFSGDLPQ